MKLYQKYILIDLFKINLLLIFLFLVFYFLIDFFNKLGDFLRFNKPIYLFFNYMFWKLWVNLYEFFPFVCGLSGILLLLWLKRTGELLAFLSLGFSKKELVKIVIKGLFLIAFLGGIIINIIFPKAVYYTLYIWDYKIAEKKQQYLIFNEQIFFPGQNYYLIATPLEPKGEYLKDILIVFLEKEFPKKIIWAEEGFYYSSKWHFNKVIIQKAEKDFSPQYHQKLNFKLPIKPETLVVVEKPLKFLSFSELFKRLTFLKKVERPYDDVLAEIWLKIFYIFLPLYLGIFPIIIFINSYAPSDPLSPILKSFVSYFILFILFLILQGLLRKGFLEAGMGIVGLLIINFPLYKIILRRK